MNGCSYNLRAQEAALRAVPGLPLMSDTPILISPSLLSCDFANIERDVKAIEAAGATATPEAIEKQKKLRETRRETMLAVKGHSTLRLTDIAVDKPIPVAELKPEPPAIPPPNPAR